jgi:hypothetical protein
VVQWTPENVILSYPCCGASLSAAVRRWCAGCSLILCRAGANATTVAGLLGGQPGHPYGAACWSALFCRRRSGRLQARIPGMPAMPRLVHEKSGDRGASSPPLQLTRGADIAPGAAAKSADRRTGKPRQHYLIRHVTAACRTATRSTSVPLSQSWASIRPVHSQQPELHHNKDYPFSENLPIVICTYWFLPGHSPGRIALDDMPPPQASSAISTS